MDSYAQFTAATSEKKKQICSLFFNIKSWNFFYGEHSCAHMHQHTLLM
jgi:hypothetical protein